MKPGKRIISIVSSNPYGDRRVLRCAGALAEFGYDVCIVGRVTSQFKEKPEAVFRIRRLQLWFNKGFLFYANLNIRLFFLLLFSRYDIILSNDLDTLWPARWVSRIRRKKLVYDTHEYFTEMAELIENKRVQRFWKKLENKLLPGLKHVYTVNKSIAELYSKEYNLKVKVVRNIADIRKIKSYANRNELGLPSDKFIMILQGTGINIGRGGEQAIESIQSISGCLLLVIGSGTAIETMKALCRQLDIESQVKFYQPMPYQQMLEYTRAADLGLSLDTPTNLNYKYSLPNKLFDYIHSETPVLSVRLPEVERIVNEFNCGILIDNNAPETISRSVLELQSSPELLSRLRMGCRTASATLTWDKEKEYLREIFKDV